MGKDDQAAHRKALGDQVLRKIGRNVVLFQQIEGLLKFLIVNHHTDGTTTDIMKRRQQRAEKIQMQMMGKLVEQYTDDLLSDAGESPREHGGVTQPWMSFTFIFNGESDFYESQRANLKMMVDERNDLMHHFLRRWQPDSLEHLMAAISYLDQQHEKVLPMFEHLKSAGKTMQECQETIAAFLTSGEGQRQFELIWLQHSSLVTVLREVAIQKARSDGWAYLAHAGQLARIQESDEVTHIKERYGHSTLKRLLIASELFDVLDETLPNGRFRTLYRLKTLKH